MDDVNRSFNITFYLIKNYARTQVLNSKSRCQ